VALAVGKKLISQHETLRLILGVGFRGLGLSARFVA
jgi:hypothetical protein